MGLRVTRMCFSGLYPQLETVYKLLDMDWAVIGGESITQQLRMVLTVVVDEPLQWL